MNYVGVDVHKKYSVLCALDERGRKLREGRVEGNSSSGFAQFFAGLEGPSKAVVEACWNWGLIHDKLDELERVEEVVLAHPYKTRLIADAQIKTDRLDAHALGTLLRGNLVARAHVPRRETRARKNLLRQRLYWARLRTMLRNRIHAVVDRQHELELPQCSDIFGVRGLGFLRRLELLEPDATLLREQLALHDLIAQQMKAQEKRIAAEFKTEAMHQHLLSVPEKEREGQRRERVRAYYRHRATPLTESIRLRIPRVASKAEARVSSRKASRESNRIVIIRDAEPMAPRRTKSRILLSDPCLFRSN